MCCCVLETRLLFLIEWMRFLRLLADLAFLSDVASFDNRIFQMQVKTTIALFIGLPALERRWSALWLEFIVLLHKALPKELLAAHWFIFGGSWTLVCCYRASPRWLLTALGPLLGCCWLALASSLLGIELLLLAVDSIEPAF